MGRLKKQDKPEELPKLFKCFLLSVKKQGMIQKINQNHFKPDRKRIAQLLFC
jgi:hypothetical protein